MSARSGVACFFWAPAPPPGCGFIHPNMDVRLDIHDFCFVIGPGAGAAGDTQRWAISHSFFWTS
jgi:hypothetical protein